MKLIRKLKYVGPAVLLSFLFAAPAFAQFEINPDHFDNPQTPAKKPVQKTKAKKAATDASTQPAEAKSVKAANSAATNSTAKTSASSGQAKTTGTGAQGSRATAAKQSQGKTKTSPPDQPLSEEALVVPRE